MGVADGLIWGIKKKLELIDTSRTIINAETGLGTWRSKKAKLKAGATGIENMCCVYSSIGEGYGVDNGATNTMIDKGFFGLLRNKFNTEFGDVGRGCIPVFYPYEANHFWTFSAGWTATSSYGIAKKAMQTSTGGETSTFSFNGTGFTLVGIKGTGSGAFTISIDGGAPTSFSAANATLVYGAEIATITGLSNGPHVATITKTADTKSLILISAYEIKGASGVRCIYSCRKGTPIADHASAAQYVPGIDMWTPIITLVGVTSNDMQQQTNITSYQNNLDIVVKRGLRNNGNVICSGNGRTITDTTEATVRKYMDAMKEVAISNNCVFVDYPKIHKDMATYSANGNLYDNVHPNNYGHQDMFDVYDKLLFG